MLVFVIAIALIILLISRIEFRRWYLGSKIPGPIGLPIIGNALIFLNKKPAEIWDTCVQMHRDYGDEFFFSVGSEYGCVINDPKKIEHILTSSKFIEKSETYEFLKPWLNDGLLLSKGAKWFQRRKILTPAFHFQILEKYVEIFNRQSCICVDILSKYKQTDKVDMFSLIGLCTLDVICESAMGVELNAQKNADSEYVKAVKAINHVIHIRMVSVIHRVEFIFKFTDLYKQQKSALKILHGFTDKVIRERREELLTNVNRVNDKSDDTIQEKKNLLDILLQSTVDGKPLSNIDIREEVDTFMFEGHDTTSSALLFCFYSIAKYPEVQRQCFQEIRDVLGDDCKIPASFKDLNNLKYLDAVLRETLRIFPSVPIFGRKLNEEITIGKYTYPKGSTIGLSQILLGRDPKLYPNPYEFKPERFLEEKTADNFIFSYIAFSAGSRNCIGQKFAALEVKTILSKVLRHFEISLAEDSLEFPRLLGQLILSSENTINFHLKPRLY